MKKEIPRSKQRPAPDSSVEKARSALGRLIDDHLGALDWNQLELAKLAEVTQWQLSRWMTSEDPSVGRSHICRLAYAIAGGYREANKKRAVRLRWGVDSLDAVLNSFLKAAGFGGMFGRPENLVWDRLFDAADGGEKRRLRVGWIPYRPFCYSLGRSKTTGSEELAGRAIDIMVRVADLTGFEIEWEQCSWTTAFDDLRTNQIDLVCPIVMVLPIRIRYELGFSRPIPEIALGVNGLVHRSKCREIRGALSRELSDAAVPIVTHAIEGEVGSSLQRIFAPTSTLGQTFLTSRDALQTILQEPIDPLTGAIRCLVADHTICVDLKKSADSEVELVHPDANRTQVKLPVAFAAHSLEPKLISMIDLSLKLMEESGYFKELFAGLSEYGVVRRMG